MKKGLLIFPFNRESIPLVRCCECMLEYTVTSLVAFPGSGLVGERFVSGDKSLVVSADYSQALVTADAVLLSDVWHKIDFQVDVLPKINEALEKGKTVLCSKTYLELNRRELLPHQANKGFQILPEPEQRMLDPMVSKINAPVVYVAGMAQNTGKFEIEIRLKQEFQKAGYKVSLVASRPDSSVFGATAFPSYMFDGRISDADKIYSFSRMVKEVELRERPDIIIIGIPGAILPYSYKYTKDFGLTALLVNYAVPPDSAVLCSLCPVEDDIGGYLSGVNNLFYHQFGIEIAFNFVSEYTFDFATLETTKQYEYVSLTDNFVKAQSEKIDPERCRAVFDPAGTAYAMDRLISRLAGDTLQSNVIA